MIFLILAIYLIIGLLIAMWLIKHAPTFDDTGRKYMDDITDGNGEEAVERSEYFFNNILMTNKGFLEIVLLWPFVASCLILAAIIVAKHERRK